MSKPYPYFEGKRTGRPASRRVLIGLGIIPIAAIIAIVAVAASVLLAPATLPVVGASPGASGPNASLIAIGGSPGTSGPAGSDTLVSSPPDGSPGASASPEGTPLPNTSPPPTCPSLPAGAHAAGTVSHGSRAQKVIALTFDDGYNSPNVRTILSILEAQRVNATFFPIGRAITDDPATWRTVAAARYPIANHTYDHPDLKTLCYAGQLSQLTKQDLVVKTDIGVPPLEWMRPPYGDYNLATRVAAANDGKRAVVLWDVDTKDWTGLSTAAIISRALAGGNGDIVLMHTFPNNTVAALPAIIRGYRARGFRFVTIGQLLNYPGPVPFPFG